MLWRERHGTGIAEKFQHMYIPITAQQVTAYTHWPVHSGLQVIGQSTLMTSTVICLIL